MVVGRRLPDLVKRNRHVELFMGSGHHLSEIRDLRIVCFHGKHPFPAIPIITEHLPTHLNGGWRCCKRNTIDAYVRGR